MNGDYPHTEVAYEFGGKGFTERKIDNSPRALVDRFWDFQRGTHGKATPVYAITNERGYCLGWSVNKRQAEKEMGKYGEAHGTLKIERWTP